MATKQDAINSAKSRAQRGSVIVHLLRSRLGYGLLNYAWATSKERIDWNTDASWDSVALILEDGTIVEAEDAA